MQFIISDASVLIDIEYGHLTRAMFDLPFQFIVPDILFVEELLERHASLLVFGLIRRKMSGQLIKEAYNLRQQYPRPSVNDLLTLTLANYNNYPLLTGDKALREVARIFNIEVHGTIWLVEQMIKLKLILLEDAYLAFHCMKNAGSRLPWNEVERMLKAYENFTVADQ